jgi:hypothetical protein
MQDDGRDLVKEMSDVLGQLSEQDIEDLAVSALALCAARQCLRVPKQSLLVFGGEAAHQFKH